MSAPSCSCWCLSTTTRQHCIHALQLRDDGTQDNSTRRRLAPKQQLFLKYTTRPSSANNASTVETSPKGIIATVRSQLRQGIARSNNCVIDCTTSCPLNTRGKLMDVSNHTGSFAIVRISDTLYYTFRSVLPTSK